MAFVFLFLGMILLVVGIRGTQQELGELIADLFTGPNNLTFWAFAILAVGALGYIKSMRSFSIAMMTLILVSLVVGNRGFFDQLVSQIRSGTSGAQLRSSLAESEFQTGANLKWSDGQLFDYLGGNPYWE